MSESRTGLEFFVCNSLRFQESPFELSRVLFWRKSPLFCSFGTVKPFKTFFLKKLFIKLVFKMFSVLKKRFLGPQNTPSDNFWRTEMYEYFLIATLSIFTRLCNFVSSTVNRDETFSSCSIQLPLCILSNSTSLFQEDDVDGSQSLQDVVSLAPEQDRDTFQLLTEEINVLKRLNRKLSEQMDKMKKTQAQTVSSCFFQTYC